MKNLDLYKEGAGKTPFRNYLSVVVQNVFRSMARKDLVEEIGPDGKPVMTEELDEKGLPVFDTDEKGNVKKDDAGRPVVKMKTRMISRYVADLKAGLEAWGDHKNRLWAPPPSNKEYLSLLLDVITLAYLEVHERKGFRDGWAYDAMTAIFEEAQPERDVAKRLVKQGIIKSEGTLHTAKSRFAEAWREKWMALYRDVVRSQHARGREDSYMAEVWREARDMVGKKRNLNILRKNIAEWALSYATKATGKGADRNVRHRM